MASWAEFRVDGLKEHALGCGLFWGDVRAEDGGVAEVRRARKGWLLRREIR